MNHSLLQTLTDHLATRDARLLFACQVGEAVEGTVPAGITPTPGGVRFLYAHPMDWYLTIAEGPDTLDGPALDRGGPEPKKHGGEEDCWGWDLRKACRLLLRSNPLLWSWLSSPQVLADPIGLGADLRALAEAGYSRRALGHALWGEARKALTAYLDRGEAPTAVKSVKAARALLAIRWMDQPNHPLPPATLPALLEGLAPSLAENVRAELTGILDGTTTQHPALYRWINTELDTAADRCAALPDHAPAPETADSLYRRIILSPTIAT